MSYTVYYSKQAQKYLFRLTPSKARSLLSRLEFVASDPLKSDNNIVKLKGTKSSYRLRVGDTRILYQLDNQEKTIFVTKISPRGSAYTI